MKRLLISCCLLSLCSCAFGNRHVTLNFQDTETPSASNDKIIVLAPFTDQRADRKIVGEVRNGYGMHTADVIADNSVEDWITNAVKTRLEKNGYKVILSTTNTTPSNFEMGGVVTEVFCTAYFSYSGKVTFLVQLQRNNRVLLQKSYAGKGGAGVNWVAASSSYGATLEAALSDALKELSADINMAVATADNIPAPSAPVSGMAKELEKLKDLRDTGVLNEDEFNVAKQKILDKL